MMQRKPVILTFVNVYLPGYKSGGPVRTLSNMINQLSDQYDFRVVTADRDALDQHPYRDVEVNQWNNVNGTQVLYLAPQSRTVRTFMQLLRDTPHDIMYLNSFFHLEFTIRPLLARRLLNYDSSSLLIAPRGEFSPGALARSRWKKKAYIAASQILGLYSQAHWHASTEIEAAEIMRSLSVAPVYVAANLFRLIEPTVNRSSIRLDYSSIAQDHRLQIVYLSRIAPHKNLLYALQVLKTVSVPVNFSIYGPIRDEGYWRECLELMGLMPDNVKVRYLGSVQPSEIGRVLATQDLLFLPTRGENFGHVIPEALSVGTPVLIANTTPWRDLDMAGAGWDLSLDSMDAFREAIELYAGFDQSERLRMREQAVSYVMPRVQGPEILEANRQVFEQCLAALR